MTAAIWAQLTDPRSNPFTAVWLDHLWEIPKQKPAEERRKP
jgi:hypothetical protein